MEVGGNGGSPQSGIPGSSVSIAWNPHKSLPTNPFSNIPQTPWGYLLVRTYGGAYFVVWKTATVMDGGVLLDYHSYMKTSYGWFLFDLGGILRGSSFSYPWAGHMDTWHFSHQRRNFFHHILFTIVTGPPQIEHFSFFFIFFTYHIYGGKSTRLCNLSILW